MIAARCLPFCLAIITLALVPAAGAEYLPPSSDPQELSVLGDHVYFSADDGLHGRELWRCDLKGDAQLVADITPGPAGSRISRFSRFNDLLLFRVDPHEGGSELWCTSGTGAACIAQFPADTAGAHNGAGGTSQPRHPKRPLVDIGNAFEGICGIGKDGRAFIRVAGETESFWITDGTAAGSRPCAMRTQDGADILAGASGIVATDEYFYFGGTHPLQGPALFRCTTAGDSVEIVSLFETPPDNLFKLDDRRFLFTAAQSGKGLELFVSEGRPDNTGILLDIAQGSASSQPSEFALIAHDQAPLLVVFTANDGVHGNEPWITDGTPEATRMLADVFPGPENSQPYLYKAFRDRITFIARNSEVGKEIWASSRPFSSVVLLGDLFPGPRGSDPYDLCALNGNQTTFSALDPEHGEELFVANASSNEALLLRDIFPGAQDSSPYWAVRLGEQVVFAATDPVNGRELWCADTNGETRLLADIYTDGSINPSASPHSLTPVGQHLFFVANDIVHGAELWVTQGDGNGTHLVRDIFPGRASSAPQELTGVDNLLYFTAEAETGRSGLWSSDGTAEGTLPVTLGAETPVHLFAVGNILYFSAHSPEEGRELWVKHPGQDPAIVRPLCPGVCSSNPRGLSAYRETLYFVADDGIHGEELWRSDGTAEGTQMIKDIAAVPIEQVRYESLTTTTNGLFAVATTTSHGRELWRYPDHRLGLALVRDIATWHGLAPH